MSTFDEKLLIERLRDPRAREAAFSLLVREYQERIYWHIRKMVNNHDDADDVTQLTFVKVWKALDKFRGDSKLKTWIYRIATNESITFINSRKRRQADSLTDVQDHLGHSTQYAGHMDGDEIQQKLMAAVATLPEKQKLVFNLKYFEAMKYDEIAEVLGGSVGSLKASFHHAVKKIEKYLTGA